MFNNLIESSSHRQEFKRRGSFLLFTTATYVVLFVITGVVSIYAYDAHLEDQTFEVVTMLPPQDLPAVNAVQENQPQRPRNNTSHENVTVPERAVAMLSVNHPEVVPDGVTTTPNKNLSVPDSGAFSLTGRDVDPPAPGGGGTGNGGRQNIPPSQIVIVDDPPPAPVPTPVVTKVLKVSKVLNSQAISLPKPIYPAMARQIRVQGTVSVQVLIDESGHVLSAKAVAGHPLLIAEAQKAAMQARFSPTLIGDQPVKVSGVISYNFIMQ